MDNKGKKIINVTKKQQITVGTCLWARESPTRMANVVLIRVSNLLEVLGKCNEKICEISKTFSVKKGGFEEERW